MIPVFKPKVINRVITVQKTFLRGEELRTKTLVVNGVRKCCFESGSKNFFSSPRVEKLDFLKISSDHNDQTQSVHLYLNNFNKYKNN